MKKFIVQCFILFSAISLSLYYLHDNWEAIVPQKKHKRIKIIKEIVSLNKKQDFMITGTSHAWAIDKNINDLKGEYLNKSGNTLYYDLQNYLFLKPYLNDSAIIILPISYFAFGSDENRTDQGEDNSFENEFYSYLPRRSIYNYSLAKECRIIKNKCQDLFFRKANNIFKNTKEIKRIKEDKKKVPQDSLTVLKWHKVYVKRHAEIRIGQHTKIGEYSDMAPNIGYLSKLIEDAQKSGYRPVLITLPYHHEYTHRFTKEWMEKFYYQALYSIKDKYGVPHLDYSSLEQISEKYELFKDSDHLNKAGKDRFNAIFQEDLRKLNYIE